LRKTAIKLKGISFTSENRKMKLVKSLQMNPLLSNLFTINKKKKEENEEIDDSNIKPNDIIKHEIHTYRICQIDNFNKTIKLDNTSINKLHKMTKCNNFTRSKTKFKTVSYPIIYSKDQIVSQLKNKFKLKPAHTKSKSLNYFDANDFYFIK
jgi:hypothetical protein